MMMFRLQEKVGSNYREVALLISLKVYFMWFNNL